MYSPKIAEDLIPLLYRLARRKKKPMTVVVDEMLRGAVKEETENGAMQQNDPG